MRVLMAALFVTMALAGCSESQDEEAQAAEEASTITAPEWVLGQHWSYTTQSQNGGGSVTVVVTGEEGGDWIVDVTDPQVAYYDALIDISYLGKIRKSDLAGSQGSDRVQFFDFPLELNKTWTTTWDGEKRDLTVNHIMDNGNVHIMAHDSNGMFAEYEYSPTAMFFDSVTFYDENGTEQYSMERNDHGLDYSGSVVRYDILEPIVVSTGPAEPHQEEVTFEGANEVVLLFHAFCNGDTAGSIFIGAGPKPDDEAVHLPPIPEVAEPDYGLGHDCDSGDVGVSDPVTVAVEDGEVWNLDMVAASQNGEALTIFDLRFQETISGPFA